MARSDPNYTPTPGSGVARILAIAETLHNDLGRLPKGREVGRLYAAEGGNPDTAATHYSKWIKKRLMNRGRDGAKATATESQGEVVRLSALPTGEDHVPGSWLTLASDGTVVLPPDVLARMRLSVPGKVHIEVVDGALLLTPLSLVIERLQAFAAQFKREGESVVDEFIAERRAEAARE